MLDVAAMVTGHEPDDEHAAVIAEVVSYLVQHPDSMDTLKGIRWWLPHPLGDRVIRGAVEELVERGWLTERSTPSGEPMYATAAAAVAEMLVWLDTRGAEPSDGGGR